MVTPLLKVTLMVMTTPLWPDKRADERKRIFFIRLDGTPERDRLHPFPATTQATFREPVSSRHEVPSRRIPVAGAKRSPRHIESGSMPAAYGHDPKPASLSQDQP